MSSRYHDRIREVLREYTDGLTVKELEEFVGVKREAIRQTLAVMPDAYIDRWTGPFNGTFASVWCVVVPPPDCPKPDIVFGAWRKTK